LSEYDTFLTVEEVCRVTGYKRHAEQRRHLQHTGIKFVVSRLGEPLVLRKAFEALMGAAPEADTALAALDEYERAQNG
jgi:hypothetical protein